MDSEWLPTKHTKGHEMNTLSRRGPRNTQNTRKKKGGARGPYILWRARLRTGRRRETARRAGTKDEGRRQKEEEPQTTAPDFPHETHERHEKRDQTGLNH